MSAPVTIPGVIVIVPDHRPHGAPAWLVTWREEGTPFAVTVYSADVLLGVVARALRGHGHAVPPLITTTLPDPAPFRREGRRIPAPPMPPANTPAEQDARRVNVTCGRR